MAGSNAKLEGLLKGNTAAETVATLSQEMRARAIEFGSGKFGRGKSFLVRRTAAGIDGEGFTCACKVNKDTAIFLLHVPDIIKFAIEAKDTMGEIAWVAARSGWMILPEPRPKRICIALKGIVNYDRAIEGEALPFSAESDEELTEEELKNGIEKTTTDSSDVRKILASLLAPEAKTADAKDKKSPQISGNNP